MVAQRPVRARVVVLRTGAQHVHHARVVGAQEQGAVTGRHVRRGAARQRAGELHADRRQRGVVGRDGIVVTLRRLQFGRERRAPVREQLGHRRFDLLALRVVRGIQAQAGGAEGRVLRFGLVGTLVADVGAVVVADVPVELQHLLARHEVAAALGQVAGADAVLALHDVLHRGDLGRGDGDGRAVVRADRAVVRCAARRVGFFRQRVQEQLVFDQRAAGPHALGGFLERDRIRVLVGGRVVALAGQAVVAVHVVHAALPRVGTGLGDGVDVAAGVALLRHVVVGDVHLHRLDRFDRDRLARGRAARGFQAERVVDRHAVDGHRVVARVLAGDRQFAALLVGLRDARVGAGIVLQVAVDRALDLQLRVADRGAGTHVGAVEDVRTGAVAGDGHGLHRCADGRVHGGGFRQLQVDAFAFFGNAVLGNRDRVRTAGTQAARDVAAFGVGRDVADRTGFGVDDLHRRPGRGTTVRARDTTGDSRRRVLRQSRRTRERDRQSQRQLRQLDPFLIDHWINPK